MRGSPPAPPPPDLLSPQVSETAYFFLDLAPAPGVRCAISAGGREHCNPDYVVRRRQYGYTVIECVAEGAGEVTLDGRKFPLGPGSVFAYRPDTACEIHTDPVRRLVKYFICLSGREAPARLARAGVPPGQAVALASHVEVQALFSQLIREGQARTKFSRRACELLLQLLLLKIQESLARRPGRPQPGYQNFSRLRQLIDAEAAGLGTLQDVARRTGVSPVLACKLFQQHLGLSPFRYLMRRKMEIAAELLVRDGVLVKEAAAQVGFRDPYHFSRRFKQAYGVAPTRLRGESPARSLRCRLDQKMPSSEATSVLLARLSRVWPDWRKEAPVDQGCDSEAIVGRDATATALEMRWSDLLVNLAPRPNLSVQDSHHYFWRRYSEGVRPVSWRKMRAK